MPTSPGRPSGDGGMKNETRAMLQDPARKAERVRGVFDSVAARYDAMNDLMSVGLHRVWKAATVAHAAVRPGMRVLDVAGGTADLSRQFARRVGPTGEVWLTDINPSMLAIGRDRLLDDGRPGPVVCCDAERLPFPDAYFDRCVVAFGLRNMTHKDRALAEMTRVLRPGGRLITLDGVFTENQSWLVRFLLKSDRGEYVRTEPAYRGLASGIFGQVQTFVAHDLFRIPDTTLIMECAP